MLVILYLGTWWHHNIWVFEKLKIDYLKNKNNFRHEIKKHFSLHHKCSLFDLQNRLAKISWTQALKSYFYQITMLTTYMFISLKKSFHKLNCLLADETKTNMFHLKLAHFRNAVLHFSIYTLFQCYTHIFTTLLFSIKRKKVLVYY